MSFKGRIPSLLLWFLTAAFMVLSGAQLLGQLEAGKISGTVRDTSGAVVPGATVTVKSVATGGGTIGAIRKHWPVPGPGSYSGNL